MLWANFVRKDLFKIQKHTNEYLEQRSNLPSFLTKNHTIEYAPKTTLPGLVICFSFFCFLSCVYVLNTLVMGASCVPPWFFVRFLVYLGNIVQSSSCPMPTTSARTTTKCCAGCIWLLLPFRVLFCLFWLLVRLSHTVALLLQLLGASVALLLQLLALSIYHWLSGLR